MVKWKRCISNIEAWAHFVKKAHFYYIIALNIFWGYCQISELTQKDSRGKTTANLVLKVWE